MAYTVPRSMTFSPRAVILMTDDDKVQAVLKKMGYHKPMIDASGDIHTEDGWLSDGQLAVVAQLLEQKNAYQDHR